MIRIPALYQERFGVRIALDYEIQAAILPDTLAACQAENVAMLIARCPAEDAATVHALTQAGGLLMDTLIYYDRALDSEVPTLDTPFTMRHARPEDAPALAAIAAESFHNYPSHFHADPRLDRAACDGVYTSWARDSVLNPAVADVVLVVEREGQLEPQIAGFLSLKTTGPDFAEGPLIAVSSQFRRQGVARTLMTGGLDWCQTQGLARMVMSTQVNNTASQRVWVRLGFEPRYAVHTFHKWFDES